jgi:hypothetical protein
MKKLSSSVISIKFLSLAIIVLASVSAQSAIISLTPSSNTVEVGDSVNINFDISGLTSDEGDSLSGFEFDTTFDSDVLMFEGFSLMDPTSGNQLDFDAIDPDTFGYFSEVLLSSADTVQSFVVTGNEDAVLDANQVGAFRFLSLTFTALKVAVDTEVMLDSINALFSYGLTSQTQTTFDSTVATLSITSSVTPPNPPQPVSVPSVFWMFFASLALILNYRRTINGKGKTK